MKAFNDLREEAARYLPDRLLDVTAGLDRVQEERSRQIRSVLETLSRTAFGDSMPTANLAARWANSYIRDMVAARRKVASAALPALTIQLESLSRISALVEQQNVLLTRLRPLADVAHPISLATRAWRDVLRLTPEASTGHYLERLTAAGRSTGWAIQTGILLTKHDATRVAQLNAQARVALGPAGASLDLRARLSALDPHLPDPLDAAWERIAAGGVGAASQAAHSLMEVVDWTLRLLAPDAAVLAWHSTEHLPESDLHNGRPIRTLRLRFAVRNSPEKNFAIKLYLRSLQELVGAIQEPKHSLWIANEAVLASIAMAVESLLLFLLVD
jgi:hypothetical protein